MRPRDNWRGSKPYKAAEFWPPRLAEHPKVGERIAEVRKLAERNAEAGEEVEKLRTDVEQAGQKDKAAFALAVRDERPRPKPTQPAAERRLEDKLAEHEALDRALSQSAEDAFDAVTEHGPTIAADLRSKELERRKGELVEAIDRVATLAAQVEETMRLATWLEQEYALGWDGGVKLGRLPRPDMPRTDTPPEFAVWVAALRKSTELIGAKRRRPEGFPTQPNAEPLKPIPAAH